MHSKFEFESQDERLVYVREIAVADLPKDMQDQADGQDTLFAVHAADGERLAIVKERGMAFHLARENDYSPVTVH
ncbi:MAG: DUF1150 family protein [Cognatishimia sp.]|uniref:DUF1150 family protein n=1 Tax=Cognatishimia sp. 1_MG-2023 TaxID=3062642 RepID=UPI0026E47BD2|nr:DUF1150 family protein [Cognatishimia sp. 1_MG-2023]MDO6725957.1 DUF1150 family protein [Cognatishimia sp. 1_MG-2023]